MSQQTPLYQDHLNAGARMVDFAGWQLPIQYDSLIEEHHAVRKAAGLFDVSHMTVVDLEGADVRQGLQKLLANNVGKLNESGRALYSCMLNEQGGILDDLICYRLEEDFYRLVVNAATRDSDLNWIQQQFAEFDIRISERDDLAMIALQGPKAPALLSAMEGLAEFEQLRPFRFMRYGDWFIARTGYTGEDGCEIILPADQASALWQQFIEKGAKPCGLGARDSLRLEAGLNLYGQDMTTETTPLESNLAWTVAFEPTERDFIGRQALEAQKQAGVERKLIGLVLPSGGIARTGARVLTSAGEGIVTSGGFSPTLERPIAIARVPVAAGPDVEIELRGKTRPAQIVALPFVRNGEMREGLLD